MQLTSILSLIFTFSISATTVIAASIPYSRAAAVRRNADPTIWHVSNFSTGCSPAGCTYHFNIFSPATSNTPGFNTTCSGTDLQEENHSCADPTVKSTLRPLLGPWNVTVLHNWVTPEDAEYWAIGQANITSGTTDFTIRVTQQYGVA
ncbi:hypothetical protein MPDQ_000197 [Monascus purpureus]|uniref:Uncharacterized protein n=1 Tax=Monascus purpureus TaxID=5098 RepID=A0A507R4T1_MONPU|nr:hypothetical protein MPDQ_000197 [Monascus purpureus]BDD59244.1 hypothetical protein MAP00_004466 [Monascus purpureus]